MGEMAKRDVDRVRSLAVKRREADEAFRQAVVIARASGETLRTIATAAGLSDERIRQILREEDARRR